MVETGQEKLRFVLFLAFPVASKIDGYTMKAVWRPDNEG